MFLSNINIIGAGLAFFGCHKSRKGFTCVFHVGKVIFAVADPF